MKIDLRFFDKKNLNTFWEFDENEANPKEILSKDFFNENIIEDLDLENKNFIVVNSNKEISSDENAQKLTDIEIEALKEKGLNNEEIIKTVIENNTSMDKKNNPF